MQIQPDEFDLVVLGTGLQESLVAAAAALAGKRVLHLDPQPEYGSAWAGLTLDRFLEAFATAPAAEAAADGAEAANGCPPGEVPMQEGGMQLYSDVEVQRREGAELGSLRQCTIDLAPKLLYTVGPLAEALLRCKADSYLAFRLVPSYDWQGGRAAAVPASRADIFKSASLSPAEKRLLMRFLKAALEALRGEGPLAEAFDARPFARLLRAEGLPPRLRQTLLYSLAMLDTAQAAADAPSASGGARASGASAAEGLPGEAAPAAAGLAGGGGAEAGDSASEPAAGGGEGANATAREALERLKLYVSSASRHGGALMVPDYGAGELPQAFCRAAAVRGALYVLRCGGRALLADGAGGACRGVRTAAGQAIRCGALAAAAHLLPAAFVAAGGGEQLVARAVAVLEAPGVEPPEAEGQAGLGQLLLTLPPGSLGAGVPAQPVRALQLGPHSSVAPPGRCLLHLSTLGPGTADLKAALASLTAAASGRQPLLAVFYTQRARVRTAAGLPANVAACQPPDGTVGFGSAVAGAQAAFTRLFPGEAFLPPLPPPDARSDSD